MDSETAEMLVNTLTNNLGIAIDNQNRIRAFELCLQEQDAASFQKYTETLENVRRNPPTAVNSEALLKLLLKLKGN